MQCLDCLCVHETFAKRGVADVAGEKGGDCLPFLTRGLLPIGNFVAALPIVGAPCRPCRQVAVGVVQVAAGASEAPQADFVWTVTGSTVSFVDHSTGQVENWLWDKM